jgi:hypothetical protein
MVPVNTRIQATLRLLNLSFNMPVELGSLKSFAMGQSTASPGVCRGSHFTTVMLDVNCIIVAARARGLLQRWITPKHELGIGNNG